MNFRKFAFQVSLLLPLGLLVSCGTTVRTDEQMPKTGFLPVSQPGAVYIKDFSTARTYMKVEGTPDLVDGIRDHSQKVLTQSLVAQFSAEAETSRLDPDAEMPKSGWLIMGEILKVYQPSRSYLSTKEGQNAKSRLLVRVWVYDLGRSSVQHFHTFNTEGRTPFARKLRKVDDLSELDPKEGVSEDAVIVAMKVDENLKSYFQERGWMASPEAPSETEETSSSEETPSY